MPSSARPANYSDQRPSSDRDQGPDAPTIWLFREKLTRVGAIEGLFARFDAALRASGYIAMSGQIVDERWSLRPSNATARKRRRRSRTAAFPTPERTSRLKSRRRIAMPMNLLISSSNMRLFAWTFRLRASFLSASILRTMKMRPIGFLELYSFLEKL